MWFPEKLKKLLVEYNINFHENRNSFILTCPYCHKRDRLYIRRVDGATICFHCQREGDFKGVAEIILAEILPISKEEIREKIKLPLLSDEDINFSENVSDCLKVAKEIQNPTIFSPTIINHNNKLFDKARNYLNNRGLTEQEIIKYDLRYDTATSRVVFPVYNTNNELLGWQGRYIYDHEIDKVPKAKNSPNFKKHLCLFAENLLDSKLDYIIITEGPIDAIKCSNLINAVATFGKIVSDVQVQKILRFKPKKIYLGLDRDAYIETMDLLYRLNYTEEQYKPEFFLLEPPENRQDLGECSFREVEEQFNKAHSISYSDFLFYF